MARNNGIEIDGQKLKKIFDKRGLKMQDVSIDCGYEGSYFSKATRENRMSKTASILLQDRYKIYPEGYEPDKEIVTAEVVTVETPKTEMVISEETAKLLHKIIYSAVYEAVKKAWTE